MAAIINNRYTDQWVRINTVKSQKMTNIPNLPIVYRVNKKKMSLLFLGSLMLSLGGLVITSHAPFIGYPCAAFFGVCALIWGINLHPNSSYLELTEQGFTTCSLFRPVFTPWVNVKGFFPLHLQGHSMVGLNYTDGHKEGVRTRRIAMILANAEGGLPDTYGMSADELAAILDSLRLRHSQ